jgi:hypothetical protein
MAIPAGVLHPGTNTIRLELTGAGDKDAQLDDLGVLQMSLEQTFAQTPKGAAALEVHP